MGTVDKVANLGRGGRLERVKPIFLLGRLWRAAVGCSQSAGKLTRGRVPRKARRQEGRTP
jgi:hypothetical protein